MFAVITHPDDSTLVLWHVDDDYESPTGIAAGAWIFGGDYPLPMGRSRELIDGHRVITSRADVEEIAEVVRAERERLRELAPKSRFPKVEEPDWEAYEEAFTGEPIAAECWVMVRGLAELISTWHGIERVRRRLKKLREEAPDYRPLPVPERLALQNSS